MSVHSKEVPKMINEKLLCAVGLEKEGLMILGSHEIG
jgi:hypothetical protein